MPDDTDQVLLCLGDKDGPSQMPSSCLPVTVAVAPLVTKSWVCKELVGVSTVNLASGQNKLSLTHYGKMCILFGYDSSIIRVFTKFTPCK